MARQQVGDRLPRSASETTGRSVPFSDASATALVGRWWLWPLAIYLTTRLINVVMIAIASSSSHHPRGVRRAGWAPLRHRRGHGAARLPDGSDPMGRTVVLGDSRTRLPVGTSDRCVWQCRTEPVGVLPAVSIPRARCHVRDSARLSHRFGGCLAHRGRRGDAPALPTRGSPARPTRGHLAVLAMSTFICAPVMQISYTEGSGPHARPYGDHVRDPRALLVGGSRSRAPRAHARGRRGVCTSPRALRVPPLAAGVAVAATGSPLALLAVWAGLVGVIWPIIVGFVTGEPRAYFLTQQAWNPELRATPIARFLERQQRRAGRRSSPPPSSQLFGLCCCYGSSPLVSRSRCCGPGRSPTSSTCWLSSTGTGAPSATTCSRSPSSGRWSALASLKTGRASGSQLPVAFAVIGVAAQWWWIRYCLIVSRELVQVP